MRLRYGIIRNELGEKMTKETEEEISMDMAMETVTFEKKHGPIALIKVITSILCRTLVDKGVCTADELKDAMRSTMTATDKQLSRGDTVNLTIKE